jgi:hypothetical protein
MVNGEYNTVQIKETICAESVAVYNSDNSNTMYLTLQIITSRIKDSFQQLNVHYKYDKKNKAYFIEMDDENIYYSDEFGKLIGELDYNYLLENNIHNVHFVVDYSKINKKVQLEETQYVIQNTDDYSQGGNIYKENNYARKVA